MQIEIDKLTKDYGDGRGVFDVSLGIREGEMFGFVGTNGAGKTTTIRHIMGFLKPDAGHVRVKGLDAWRDASEIKRHIGYVPGEIAFPDLATGTEFLKSQAEFLGVTDMKYANELIERLQLDPSANLRRMSKGMKQKTALVEALMADPEIVILDEPTTGLDPLMRAAFLDIIREVHSRGKTVLMSSHMFEELEATCDRVALINRGRIDDVAVTDDIRNRPFVDFKIEFRNREDYLTFRKKGYAVLREQPEYCQVTISLPRTDIGKLFSDLLALDVKFIAEVKFTLEKYFKDKLLREKELKKNV